LLGQIDSPESTTALALLAVHAKLAEDRRVAGETLIHRDPREFVGLLIGFVQETSSYGVKSELSQNSSGELIVNGPMVTLHRIYRPSPLPYVQLMPGDFLQYDQFGLPVISRYAGSAQSSVLLSSGTISTVRDFVRRPGQIRAMSESSFRANNASWVNNPAAGMLANAAIATIDQNANGIEQTALRLIDEKGGAAAVGGRRVNWSTNATRQTEYRELIPIGQMVVATMMANEQLHAKMVADAMQIEMTNSAIGSANDRVLPILQATTGQNFGADKRAWSRWWTDNLGYSQSQAATKPEVFDVVQASTPNIPFGLSASSFTTNASSVSITHSCFGRGTPVQTLTGLARIESLKVGDMVLASETTSGTLSYQPIVAIHHNPPAETFKVDLGSDTVVATGIHRLWKAGKGWVMVRDLRPGDVLRTIGGTVEVKQVTAEKVQPVFNLEVAEGHDFFVGKNGVLAHDNSLIQPVADPFDARPELAAIDAK
jgi:hypothetical protein